MSSIFYNLLHFQLNCDNIHIEERKLMDEKLFRGHLLIRNIATITRAMHDIYDEEYKNYGLIKSRDAVLRRVVEQPGTTQDLLGYNLKLNKATISRILKILETDGYVIRKSSLTDTRNKEVYPTEKGREAYSVVTSVLFDMIEQCVLPEFSDEDLDKTVEVMNRIRRNIDKYWYEKKLDSGGAVPVSEDFDPNDLFIMPADVADVIKE